MDLKTISKDLQKYINDSIKDGIAEKTGIIEKYDEMILQFIEIELIHIINNQKKYLSTINLETQSVIRIQLEAEINILETILEEIKDYVNDFEVSKNLKKKLQNLTNN